jgi:DUF971 family protein
MSSEACLPPSAWPSAVTVDTRARTLELVWDDREATLTHAALRSACRCSQCENARRTAGAAPAAACDVVLERIEPLGAAALQLFFSDGHARGISPWTYLKQMAFGAAPDTIVDAISTTSTTGEHDE